MGRWTGQREGHSPSCGVNWEWPCDCAGWSQTRECESTGCHCGPPACGFFNCRPREECSNPFHRYGIAGLQKCRADHYRCGWWTTDPTRLCEEHLACGSCGSNPCLDDCLGPQEYECQGCRRFFLRHQLSRIGAADLCRRCDRGGIRF